MSAQTQAGSTNVRQSAIRARINHARGGRSPHVAFQSQNTRPSRLLRQALRVSQFQQRWENIKQDLPPQLSRRHKGRQWAGTTLGVFGFWWLTGADALKHGGPVGALLGYSIIGSVVYCLCVSVGEMIAFLPNVGGVVGLADLYVDPAVGFSLGWAAWYNWSVTLPAEITAAAILVQFWDHAATIKPYIWSSIFLVAAIGVNLFSSRVYGEVEFWLSTIKVLTIVTLIIICLVIDLGAGAQGLIGFKNWAHPFVDSYYGINGSLGKFLGFWAVLMQASFSFFGSEVPGIAAGEVIDATRNVPKALRRVWIRICIFYVGGVFSVGLLLPLRDPEVSEALSSYSDARSSPFVVALNLAKIRGLPHVINAAMLLSAWSAAASDLYISSRFLFFLARCHHAPQFLASLVRYPSAPKHEISEDEFTEDDRDESDVEEKDEVDGGSTPPVIRVTRGSPTNSDGEGGGGNEGERGHWAGLGTGRRGDMAYFEEGVPSEVVGLLLNPSPSSDSAGDTSPDLPTSHSSRFSSLSPSPTPSISTRTHSPQPSISTGESGAHVEIIEVPRAPFGDSPTTDRNLDGSDSRDTNIDRPELDEEGDEEEAGRRATWTGPSFVLPLSAVLASASVGLLCFLGTAKDSAQAGFDWLVAVASVASLQSWAGILFTYIRFHQGTSYAERTHGPAARDGDQNAQEVIKQIKKIREHRHIGQPYLAWYAFMICVAVLFTNGWTVFVQYDWRITNVPGVEYKPKATDVDNSISIFLSSYIPIPFFLLLTFGYKLIYRTKMVKLHEMSFKRENVPEPETPPSPKTKSEGILRWLLLN